MDRDNQLVDLDNDMLRTIDNDDVIDNSAGFDNSEVGTNATQGLTPMHRQNVDEATGINLVCATYNVKLQYSLSNPADL